MMRTLVVMTALAAVLGCKSKRAAPPPPPSPAPPVALDADDAIFVIATPEVTTAALPARFAAPLPTTPDAIAAAPPDPYVDNALATGAARMRERLLEAVSKAGRSGPLPEELYDYAVARLHAAEPGACDWIAGVAASTAPPSTRAPFWDALDHCTGRAIDAAFARDDAPDAAIINRYFERTGERVPFSPRIVRAATAVAGGSENLARRIGFAFAAMDGPEVVPAMIALQRSIADPHRRALVAVGMLLHPKPEGHALGVAACKDARAATDAMCSNRGDDDETAPPPPATLAEAIVDWDYDEAAVLARFKRADVIATLAQCVADPEEDAQPSRCLGRLAALDRPAAVAAARAAHPAGDDPGLAPAIAALLAFPEAGALDRELTKLGFTAAPGAGAPDPTALTAEELLTARGRVDAFDTETGQWPNEHDRVLAELAALCAPALDGVVFEELASGDLDDNRPYVLHAYADGKRYQLAAQNLGDWYDVDAVLGLLNALLIARGSDVRLVVLPTGDQTAEVVAGPRAGLIALVHRDLLAIGASGAAEATGKAFEDKVFDQLQREGADVQRDVPIAPAR